MDMDNALWAMLMTFATSLIPSLELRAGIPVGLALGLPVATATLVAVVGNLVHIPVALRMVDWAYRNAGRTPTLQRWLAKTEGRIDRYRPLIRKYGWLGLTAFVLLPLPATGVWGGVVLSRLLQVPAGGVLAGVGVGIAFSGVMVGAGLQGAFNLFKWFNPAWGAFFQLP